MDYLITDEEKKLLEEKQKEEQETLEKELYEKCGRPIYFFETISLLFLLIISDIFLYSLPKGGLGFSLYFIIISVTFIILNIKTIYKKIWKTFLWIFILCLCNSWHYSEWLISFLTLLSILYIIELHTHHKFKFDICTLIPETLLSSFYKLYGHYKEILAIIKSKTLIKKIYKIDKKKANILLIPVLIIIIFYLLFYFANPVIENITDRVINKISKIFQGNFFDFSFPEIERIIFWGIILLVFSSLLRPSKISKWLKKNQNDSEMLNNETEVIGMEFLTSTITLLSVCILFLIYNLLDFSYLWLNATLPHGISYSQYSRQGVLWLTIALAFSTFLIGIIFAGKNNFLQKSKKLKLISYIFACFNFLIAIGTLRRMQLYINWNGLTKLRFIGIYGIILVIIGLIFMIYKVKNNKNFIWLLRRDIQLLFIGLFIGFITPMDYISAKYNVNIILSKNLKPISWLYNQEIPSESIPPIFDLLQSSNPIIKNGTAVFLLNRLDKYESKNISWPQYQLSDYWAKKKLTHNKEFLMKCLDNINPYNAEQQLKDLSYGYR